MALSTEMSQLWKSVRGEFEVSMSSGAFITWFKQTDLVKFDGSIAEISVPNVFVKQQFESRLNDQLKQTFTKHGHTPKKIIYSIGITGSNKNTTEDSRTMSITSLRSTPQGSSSKISRTSLNPRYTFDNYIVGGSNDLAYAACQAVAANPGVKYNPLFIYGGVGLGKTHLIQAVGNEISAKKPELNVTYVNSETFVNDFIEWIRFKKKGFSDKYRRVDVLIVDDMQFIASKEKTQEEFFHTFNALHQANKQIIISSDKPPKNIPTLTERMRSRFEWGMSIDIQMPDFETRCAIIDTKAAQSGARLTRETTEYLANNIKTNIRELEGALNQLLAVAELRSIEPDIQTAMGLLSTNRQSRPSHLTSRQIIEKTAKYSGVSVAEMKGSRRDRYIVLPRQIAMYLLRSELHMSFPRIANELGRKDHTTAIHSIEKIDKALKLDLVVREQVVAIRDTLYA